ncbi:MAG: hypothetical protein ABSE51_16535 [Terracidiphilus sp.]|jgi:hypothetical protein
MAAICVPVKSSSFKRKSALIRRDSGFAQAIVIPARAAVSLENAWSDRELTIGVSNELLNRQKVGLAGIICLPSQIRFFCRSWQGLRSTATMSKEGYRYVADHIQISHRLEAST